MDLFSPKCSHIQGVQYQLSFLCNFVLSFIVCTHFSRRENSHVSMEGGKVVGGWGWQAGQRSLNLKKVMRYFPDRLIFPHVWSLGMVQWQISQNFIDMKKLK